jgi:hypothetical protein
MSDLKEKLVEAGQKAETEKAERTKRAVKGAHLQEKILALVTESKLATKDNTGFNVVVGSDNGRKLYISKKGGRIDLSGFSLPHPAVTSISEEEAKEKHLGKVRGQVNFDETDSAVLNAVEAALVLLAEVVEKEVKAAKVETKTEAVAETVASA